MSGQHRIAVPGAPQTERKKQKHAEGKDHWRKLEERSLTRAFKEARHAAGCYADWSEAEQPGFHEVRALPLQLYKRAGKDGQKIADLNIRDVYELTF